MLFLWKMGGSYIYVEKLYITNGGNISAHGRVVGGDANHGLQSVEVVKVNQLQEKNGWRGRQPWTTMCGLPTMHSNAGTSTMDKKKVDEDANLG